MKIPFSIPSETFYGALTYLGLAAVIYAVLVPTEQYDDYKKLLRDYEEEKAVLAIEWEYQEKLQERLTGDNVDADAMQKLYELDKALAIRNARLGIDELRVKDARSNWEKSRFWSVAIGLGGIALSLTGFYCWRRNDERKERRKETGS